MNERGKDGKNHLRRFGRRPLERQGSGGGTVTYGGHTFKIREDAIILLDEAVPLGFAATLPNPFGDVDESAWYPGE